MGNNKLEKIGRKQSFHPTLENLLEGCQIIGFDWRYIYLNNTSAIHNRRPKEELLGNKYMQMWQGIEDTEPASYRDNYSIGFCCAIWTILS